jgi:mono/diheme cytochrome c family protein
LYTTYCSSCHGATGTSLTGRTVDQISIAISNVTTMNNIALSLTELQAIADYLANVTGGNTGGGSGGNTGGGGGTVDGQALYTSNCAACHGADAATINDQSVSGITAAMTAIGSMTGISLTAEEIQAIADYLAGGSGGGNTGGGSGGGGSTLPPTHTNSEEGVLHADGNNNPYTNGCTACHGTTLQGGVGPSCFACHGQEWNENPPSGGGSGGGSGSTDGQALYAANCAACHGTTGSSINNNSASGITAAMTSIGSMTGISLNATEIQAISDFLTGNTGGGNTGGGGTGGLPSNHTNSEDGILHAPGNNYPYTNGCTTCHGSTLQGSAGPSCFACHGQEWNEDAPSGGGGNTGGGGGSTTDGQALYTTYCSACHGATGSNINGRTASAISNAIANVGSMNNISLSSTNIQAIADYLAGSTGGGGGGSGGGLPASHTNSEEGVLHGPGNNYPYANGCTSCHGSNLQGGVGPSCYSCHGQEWRSSGDSGGGSEGSGGGQEEDD